MTGSTTLYSRQNVKRHGAIVLTIQRLHEDDLVGHVLGQEPWEVVCFPAIAETDELHEIETIWRPKSFTDVRATPCVPRASRSQVFGEILWCSSKRPQTLANPGTLPRGNICQHHPGSVRRIRFRRNRMSEIRIAMLGAPPRAWLLRSRGKGAPLI
jgi:hypothetical protein